MMILHTADWHIGELSGPTIEGKNARLQDTLECIDFLDDYAQRDRPDAILISGDLFDKSKLWGDNMLSLIDSAAQRLRSLAKIAPTVLMFGTDNHDSMRAFENIRNMNIPGLRVVTKPELVIADTDSGQLQIACVPGFDKGYFRSKFPGMAPAEESVMCSQLLGDMVNGLSAQLDPVIPSVLMAHYTVVGCELDNGQHVFTQSEVVLPKEALAGSEFDLVALGHIHRAQQVECSGKPLFYSGAPNGISFNEEGQYKGFWMHEIGTIETDEESEMPSYVGSEFVKTPSREFFTMKADFTESQDLPTALKWALAGIGETQEDTLLMYPTVGKIVRLEYECTEEQRPLLNHKEMESIIKSGGAFHVSEIKAKRIVTALLKQELTETSGPIENLYTWLRAEGFEIEETAPILELAQPLIATISAKMPTGTLSGVFEPISLTVRNYRSYLEETLNFQEIFYAAVNGPNGIGKSSFFMDATRDCIYEETRTGITGSWITNGQTDGMIQFKFSMGSTVWQIIRNRSIKGSGKITLALQEYIDDRWEDRSGTTTRATQEKIEALLGMDCATFSCTALIMQDAYGLFMEADKEARMGVLANILGLSIYEQLTDLAKVKVAELNKQIAISKAKLADLDEKLKAKPGIVSELKTYEADLEQVAENITAKETEIKIAEELVRTLKGKAEKVLTLGEQIEALKSEALVKHSEIIEKRKQADRAQQILSNEAKIIAQSDEYIKVKDQILVLEIKKPRLAEIAGEHFRLRQENGQLEKQIESLRLQAGGIHNYLGANRDDLERAANQYQDATVRLEAMDKLVDTDRELREQIMRSERDINNIGDTIYRLQQQLKDMQHNTVMLKNSNCIDPDNAKCAFLANAIRSKELIPQIEADIERFANERVPFIENGKKANQELIDHNFDHQTYSGLKQSVVSLRPKAEEYAQITHKEELLKTLQDQIAPLEERRDQTMPRLIKLDEEGYELDKELAVLPELNERLPKLLQWVKAKEELPVARQLVESIADIVKGIEADIVVKESRIKAMEEELVTLKAEGIGMIGAQADVVKFHSDLKWLQGQQNEFHAKIGALNAQLKSLAKDEAERKQIADDMAPAAKSLVYYQTLTKAFGMDGIPFSIVRSVVSELSYMANDILGQMTGGKMALEMSTERVQKNKKEVNALEVWITDYRGRIPYGDRSGGEKVKAALANAFALADLKARRVGIQLGMMFVDEPPFLDGSGAEAYCDALEQLNHRYPNMRVIAISHDPAMKARFPQQIDVVDMGDEGSKVRIA